ncbi:MAG: UPF0079 ATP-binding protein [Parcubacteria group bacterium Gr01-1014_38]|nr:MAG: UPF0079 ATP-binding protein [Parcubacteria group bacterium Gr01-1014_38]
MITRSPAETRAAGQAFARQLQAGDVVLLEGPLGSGKTLFVQGIAEGLGASALVTSPSFVLLQEYPLSAERVLRHLDLYRLHDPTVDLDRLGLPELLADPQAITVVEWADRMPVEALAKESRRVHVRFEHGQRENERTLDIDRPQ